MPDDALTRLCEQLCKDVSYLSRSSKDYMKLAIADNIREVVDVLTALARERDDAKWKADGERNLTDVLSARITKLEEERDERDAKLEANAQAHMLSVSVIAERDASIAALKNEIQRWNESRDQMAAQVLVLVGALNWYADEHNYRWDGVPMTPYIEGKPILGDAKDHGKIAREALASLPAAASALLAEFSATVAERDRAQKAVEALARRCEALQTKLISIAADCHREKWQFQEGENQRPAVTRIMRKAFDILHRIGDVANEAGRAASRALGEKVK